MNCDRIISDEDIKLIYEIDKMKTFIEYKNCEDNNNKKSVDIELKDYKEDEILETPITRDYYEKQELINSSIKEKVVIHQTFSLKIEYRNLDLAKKIHQNELVVYKKNNFLQIQLRAVSDGLIVWRKLGYEFKNDKIEKIIIKKFSTYLIEELNLDKDFVANQIKKIKTLKDINNKLLLPKDKVSFSDWLRKKEDTFSAEMFKDIK